MRRVLPIPCSPAIWTTPGARFSRLPRAVRSASSSTRLPTRPLVPSSTPRPYRPGGRSRSRLIAYSSGTISEGEQGAEGGKDAVFGGPGALQGGGEGDGGVGAADPADGGVEPGEGFLADDGGDLGAEAAGERGFVGHQGPGRAAHRVEDRGSVPGAQRAQVDDLDLVAVLGGDPVGRAQGPGHAGAVGDHRGVGSGAGDEGAAQGLDVVAGRDGALGAAVQLLVLQ